MNLLDNYDSIGDNEGFRIFNASTLKGVDTCKSCNCGISCPYYREQHEPIQKITIYSCNDDRYITATSKEELQDKCKKLTK